MSPQADYVVSNGTGAAVRSDINGQLAAIVSNNSGASAPATTYAYMLWADTSTNLLKLRNGANSAWITIGDLTAANLGLAALASPTFTGTVTIPTATISTGAGIPLASAASPAIYFTGDTNTGIYSPGADQFAITTGGSGRVFVDSSGRVGLGTSSPGGLLHVDQATAGSNVLRLTGNYSASGTSPLIVFERSGGAVAGHLRYNDAFNAMQIGTTSAHRFDLYTNSSTALTIDSSQRVGIGVTAPATALHLGNSSTLRINNTDGTRTLDLFNDANNAEIKSSVDPLRLNAFHSSGYIRFDTNNTERGRWDNAGRFLVGTSTARANFDNSTETAQFQIEGLSANTSSTALVHSANNSGCSRLIFGKSRGGSIGSNAVVSSGDLIGEVVFQGNDGSEFVEGAKIQAVIDATPGANDMPSRLVFSTTADGASSPTARFQIDNRGLMYGYSTDAGYIQCLSNGAGTTYRFFAGRHSSTGANGSGTETYQVWSNGNVQNTNGSFTSISDQKLKENIVDAGSQWDDLKAIQIRNWNFKEETGYETHRQIGPVAQELEQVCPGLVFETPDQDDKGNDLGTTTKGVNQSVLYMKAVKALQEAMERIEALEAKVAALEAS